MIAALSGASDEATAPRLFWEGQAYRLDLAFAELSTPRECAALRRPGRGVKTVTTMSREHASAVMSGSVESLLARVRPIGRT